jgi:serine/threonine protein kinase
MPEFMDLVSKMTHLNPREHITAREALEHPWFQDV